MIDFGELEKKGREGIGKISIFGARQKKREKKTIRVQERTVTTVSHQIPQLREKREGIAEGNFLFVEEENSRGKTNWKKGE